jgi:hypothetical protein
MTISADGQETSSRRAFLQFVAALGTGMAVLNNAAVAGDPRPKPLIVLTDQEREENPRRLMRDLHL